MKKCATRLFMTIFSLFILASCSGNEKTLNTVKDLDDMVYTDDTEPLKGKLNVYSSMTRAVKYHTDPALKRIRKKFAPPAEGENAVSPEKLMQDILGITPDGDLSLYDSVRMLDFAVMYAMTRLVPDEEYVEKNLYAKTAQNLSLQAITAHKDALLAAKKIKEIDRILVREKKVSDGLAQKLSRNGVLNKNDQELKKGTDVAIYKFTKLRETLEQMRKNYLLLVKAADDAALEGRHFYELEDFDARNKLDTFQTSGVLNRSEFRAMADLGKEYTVSGAKGTAIRMYPEIETLNLNGYNIKDALYIDNLKKRAAKITTNLLNAVTAFEKAKFKEQRERLRDKAFDEVCAAILAQIEIDYDIVRTADADFNDMAGKVSKLRKEIKTLEYKKNLTVGEKTALLDKKAEFLQLEMDESLISAERAAALRGLYFHSGLSPFSRISMKGSVDVAEENLKVAFNRDMVEMLAQAEAVPAAPKKTDEAWAKGDNWLNELVDKPQVVRKVSKPTQALKSFAGNDNGKYQVLQLGAYVHKNNAASGWASLKETYPQLKPYSPEVEAVTIDGQVWHRLLIKSDKGGLAGLCRELQTQGAECILR